MKSTLIIFSLLLIVNVTHSQIRLEIDNQEIKEYFQNIADLSDSLIANDLVTISHGDGFEMSDYEYKYQNQIIVYAYEEILKKGGVFTGVIYYSPENSDLACELTHDKRGREKFHYYIIKYNNEFTAHSVKGKPEKYQVQIEHIKKIMKYEP